MKCHLVNQSIKSKVLFIVCSQLPGKTRFENVTLNSAQSCLTALPAELLSIMIEDIILVVSYLMP